jgi:thymidylate synthase (FAD)
MDVKILNITDPFICSHAIRTCWQSFKHSDKDIKDLELIDRVGNKYKHSSTLEHIIIQAEINKISRALLQQLSRHRHISLSVKSTRYTLKELKGAKLNTISDYEKYIKLVGNLEIDQLNMKTLNNIKSLIEKGYSNDFIKYALPECYLTQLTITLNLREFIHIAKLRLSKSALWEFRELMTIFLDEIKKYDDRIYNLIISGINNAENNS